jgi:predicted membrane chloride channel (bestrophin family)
MSNVHNNINFNYDVVLSFLTNDSYPSMYWGSTAGNKVWGDVTGDIRELWRSNSDTTTFSSDKYEADRSGRSL